MQCEEVRKQITDHVTGGLNEPLKAEIAMHLDTCESCRAEFADAEELSAVWIAMGAVTAHEPGPEGRARFDLMVGAYQQGLDQGATAGLQPGTNSWFGGWWPRRPALQFGFGLVLLMLGVLAGQQWRPASAPAVPPRTDEIAELRGQMNAMSQMVALSLMQNQSAGDRLRGVNWSYQLQKPGDEVLGALLATLMHDPNVNVRLATVDALRQFGDQSVVRRGVLEAMKKQESPMVQVALIDLAVDLQDKESIGTLREFTRNEKLDAAVRERAQEGLAELE
jgi:hypothetical protein